MALSGMQAAQAQLNVAAQNVANLQTPGYQPQRADLVDLSTGGVAVAGVTQAAPAGGQQTGSVQTSGADLGSDIVDLTRSRLLYSANAAIIRIGGKMTGSLLDMFDSDHT